MTSMEEEAVNRITALVSSRCRAEAFIAALGFPELNDVFIRGPADLLQLFLAGLQEAGARKFLDCTEQLVIVPSGPKPRRRVAIYAGNFDPVTNSHLTVAAEIVHSTNADEVWLVPCGQIWKSEASESIIHRFVMCQIAISTMFSSGFPARVKEVEFRRSESLQAYDLLCLFRDLHPDMDFCFVIGSDRLLGAGNVTTWTSRNKLWKPGDPEDQKFIVTGRQMLDEFDFLVIPRLGSELPPTKDDPTGLAAFGTRLSWLSMPTGTTFIQGNLSSEDVISRTKRAIKRGDGSGNFCLQSVDGLVPPGVLSYIWRYQLYMGRAGDATNKRVAIYGGAFDPITNSHLTCAAEIVHSGCADEVWIVPCGPRPDKPKLKTSPLDRYTMCQIAVQTQFTTELPVKVSDIECFSDEAFPTYDLLCSLRAKHPNTEFLFIIGSDWLQPGSNMAEWTSKNWDWKPGDPEDQRTIVTGHKMLQEFGFLVIKRPRYEVPTTDDDPTGLKQFGPRLSWLQMPEGFKFVEGNLSSTELRKRASMNGSFGGSALGFDGLISPGVQNYAKRRGLYSLDPQ